MNNRTQYTIGLAIGIMLLALNCFGSESVTIKVIPQVGHSFGVRNLFPIEGTEQFVSVGGEGTVKVWDLKSKSLVKSINIGSFTFSAAFSKQKAIVVSSAGPNEIRFWDLASGGLAFTLSTNMRTAVSLAFAPSGELLFSGHRDGSIAAWDVTQQKLINSWHALNASITAVVVSPNGRFLFAAGGDGTVTCWDISTFQLKWQRHDHREAVHALVISADGKYVLSGGGETAAEENKDTALRLVSVSDGKLLRELVGHKDAVRAVTFIGNNENIASADDAGVVRIWDMNSVEATKSINGPDWGQYGFESIASVPNESKLLLGSLDAITTLDIPSGRIKTEYQTFAAVPHGVAISGGGQAVAIAADSEIFLWQLQNNTYLRTSGIPGASDGSDQVDSLAISENGRFVAWRWDKSAIDILDQFGRQLYWHIPNSRQTKEFYPPSQMRFSVDGTRLLLASDDKSVRLYDVPNKALLGTHAEHAEPILDAAFLPDGSIISIDRTGLLIRSGVKGGERRLKLETTSVFAAQFAPDSSRVLTVEKADNNSKLRLRDTVTGGILKEFDTHPGSTGFIRFSPDGQLAISGGSFDSEVRLWDVGQGNFIRSLVGHSGAIAGAAITSNNNTIITASNDGTSKVWDISGREIASLSFERNHGALLARMNRLSLDWILTSPDGRFDAGRLDPIIGIKWNLSDDPYRAFAPEIFMRDYYEPRLLPRLLACHDSEAKGNADACAHAFKPIRSLAELNRIQPDVKIVGMQRGASADEVLVDVEVTGKKDPTQKNGKTKTEVYDLRLFRDGQVVGQWPQPAGGIGGAEDIDNWREEAKVPMADGQTKTVHRFAVNLARRDKGQPVRLTAYAFNEDRVKSETASDESYKVPDDVEPAKPRAYVITIGVNAYQNPSWKLTFAVKDAQDVSGALQQIQGYEVVPVSLVSTENGGSKLDKATKANIEAVLALLAGKGEPFRDLLVKAVGPIAEKLQKASPDDLVILAFSGHGYTDQQARFYLLPSDSGIESKITHAVLPKFISSDELSQWLRDVDAGEMVMLIDACHSAASVPEGFKPGPMGDRGLGQLAYDKGMQILAATQADDVALESEKLGQGLLTYALVDDGLKARKAAPDGKGPITIKSWLRYAEKRVPELYDEISAGKRRLASKDPIIDPAFYAQAAKRAQTPALFDFYKQKHDPVVRDRQR